MYKYITPIFYYDLDIKARIDSGVPILAFAQYKIE